MGIRDKLAKTLDRTGILNVVLKNRRGSDQLTVLTYHRVNELPSDYPYDADVVDATPSQFEEQLRFLQEHHHVVGLDALRRFCDGEPLPPRATLITFDDGYRDNHDVAMPMLQRFGMSAVFFIATRYIDERRLYWWDKINYLVNSATSTHVSLDYPVPLRFELPRERAEALSTFVILMKEMRGLDTERFLSEVAEAVGVPWSRDIEREHADALLMNWDDLRAMKAGGMDIQSHSHNHQPLHTMLPEALDSDLRLAKSLIEKNLSTQVDTIAYPVGRPIIGLNSVVQTARDAGYRYGFTNGMGCSPLVGLEPFDIGRHAMDTEMPMSLFRGMLALPELLQET